MQNIDRLLIIVIISFIVLISIFLSFIDFLFNTKEGYSEKEQKKYEVNITSFKKNRDIYKDIINYIIDHNIKYVYLTTKNKVKNGNIVDSKKIIVKLKINDEGERYKKKCRSKNCLVNKKPLIKIFKELKLYSIDVSKLKRITIKKQNLGTNRLKKGYVYDKNGKKFIGKKLKKDKNGNKYFLKGNIRYTIIDDNWMMYEQIKSEM